MDFKTLYNINVAVDYKKHEDNGEDDVHADTKYREQLLNCLNITIEQFDDMCEIIEKIRKYITPLLEVKFTDSQREIYNEILLKCAGRFMCDDTSMGFMILFSYDYFDLIHSFIKHLITNNEINTDLLDELKNKICE
jgi:hypothetical protein